MDPDACLEAIRAAIAEARSARNEGNFADAAGTAIDRIEDLDGWLSRGGFLPRPWRQARLDPAEQR